MHHLRPRTGHGNSPLPRGQGAIGHRAPELEHMEGRAPSPVHRAQPGLVSAPQKRPRHRATIEIMPPRVAIPLPHFSDPEYAERAIPQYERAVTLAGGEPVRVPLDRTPEEVHKIIEHCDAVLLPGSKADVEPARFHAPRSPHTAAAD